MGNSDEPTELEARSEAIFRCIVGGASTFTDVRGADLTPDWRFDLANGTWAAVEVTTSTDGATRAQFREIEKHDWEAPSLRSSWSVSMPHTGVNFKSLYPQIEGLLATLEDAGVEGFNHESNLGPLDPAARKAIVNLRALGLLSAASINTPPGANRYIVNGAVGPGAWVNADEVAAVVEQEAAANASKLLASGANERHLFIWIDWSKPGPEAAMFFGQAPATSPTLPAGVDVVWIATRPRPKELDSMWAGFLWRYSASSGWEVLSPPARLAIP